VPLELVRAFDDEEREAAWALLHELGHLFTRKARPAGTTRGWQPGAASTVRAPADSGAPIPVETRPRLSPPRSMPDR
jgi:hypothetical protein